MCHFLLSWHPILSIFDMAVIMQGPLCLVFPSLGGLSGFLIWPSSPLPYQVEADMSFLDRSFSCLKWTLTWITATLKEDDVTSIPPSLPVNACAPFTFLPAALPVPGQASELKWMESLPRSLHSDFFGRRTCSKPLECRRSYSRSLIVWIPAFLRQSVSFLPKAREAGQMCGQSLFPLSFDFVFLFFSFIHLFIY